MMQQYMEQKERYSDTLLFFRMGDFFEMFFDDAVTAAGILDIALTKRGAKDGDDIPMCGVPAHSYEPYLHKLINAGYKVAICDQLESPEEAKKRGYKEIVRREVVRVITPGTITEENLLEAKKSNYLMSLAKSGTEYGVAWIDISTGSFFSANVSRETFGNELARINPSEILLADDLLYEENFYETYNEWKSKLSPQASNIYEFKRAENKLKSFYKVISLEGFGALTRAQICACGGLLEYIELTQKEALPSLQFPRQFDAKHYMQIDFNTRRNLEILQPIFANSPSLLQIIDRTKTSGGGRLLYSWLSAPLIYAEGINARLEAVDFFFEETDLRGKLREKLGQFPDIERALARISMGRATPRDMLITRNALLAATEIKNLLNTKKLPKLLADNIADINPLPTLLNKLIEAFRDEVGVHLNDGNFIRPEYNSNLQNLINIRDHSRKLITELKEKYALTSGINNLKINHNNILGYYVEVTAQNAGKLSEEFIHRQTMANAMRFTTAELNELQTKIINARNEALQLELQIFAEFAEEIRQNAEILMRTARAIAFSDVICGFSELAAQNNYTKPKIDDSDAFTLVAARHPVVETATEFAANDCDLNSAQNLWLLTGPNMAGKSTFLRQNALITIMAQCGSYVPAKSAHIGCVDKIFSRVGASDNLSRGQSTFMVEMVETAAILNQASAKSLVILDEIGRGTATYDGLSIAWAVLEYLHNIIKCRAIFATHYHELTKLELERISLHSMKVKEWNDEIVFLHQVGKGAADKSYGIHVAELAGLPKSVTNRAKKILNRLESQSEGNEYLPLFEQAENMQVQINPLDDINPDELSPKQALEVLYKLKSESQS
ncbi:MAG: DNA mismatch repair protein MutS [Alphaproteobacteria bacterium CG11_big_fil_rev_8_21_14_0_20_44_7]|nr:MAG: DNA mismatch repair protein MutS [Alphaproteobacteria bacterium CG11_big_fil_rev_8_21_14_0_20_44_7]